MQQVTPVAFLTVGPVIQMVSEKQTCGMGVGLLRRSGVSRLGQKAVLVTSFRVFCGVPTGAVS